MTLTPPGFKKTANVAALMAAPHERNADAVGEYIDGGLQAEVDLAHCHHDLAVEDFLLKRLEFLFQHETPEAYRSGYCRLLQKYVERGGATAGSLGRAGWVVPPKGSRHG